MTGFRCECWLDDCAERIPLSAEDWRMVRAEPNRFAVAPHHVANDVEAVVEKFSRFWLVAKLGEAGEVAEELAAFGLSEYPQLRVVCGLSPRSPATSPPVPRGCIAFHAKRTSGPRVSRASQRQTYRWPDSSLLPPTDSRAGTPDCLAR